MSGQHYTYMHVRADDGRPFYVGKGRGRRAWDTNKRSEWWKRVVGKHGRVVHVLAHWDTAEEAFEHEKLLIACFRDLGHPICNLTHGGDGARGTLRSEAFKRRVSEIHRGKVVSVETRAKLSASHRGARVSPEHRQKLREANLGKKMSAEAIEKTRAAHLGSKRSAETRARISAAKSGAVASEQTRRRMSEAHLARHALKRQQALHG